LNRPEVKTKGIDRAAQNEALLSAAGIDVLGALGTGIVCVLPDGTVSTVNEAAAEALGAGTNTVGSDFWSAFPALHDGRGHQQIAATILDGTPRVFPAALPGGRADAIHEVRVSRTTPRGRLALAWPAVCLLVLAGCTSNGGAVAPTGTPTED